MNEIKNQTQIQNLQKEEKVKTGENKQIRKTPKPRESKVFAKGDHLFQIKHKLDAMISQAEGVPDKALEALHEARMNIWEIIKSREESPLEKAL